MLNKDYSIHVATISELYPGSAWIPVLQRGNTRANVLYVEYLLSELDLSTSYVVDETIEAGLNSDKLTDLSRSDRYTISLTSQLNKLMALRVKLSNRFHTLNTRTQRRALSQEIENVQDNIATIMKSLDYYRLTGVRIEDFTDKFDLPHDKFRLDRKVRSLRAQVSKQRKIIKEKKSIKSTTPEELHTDEAYLRKLLIAKLYAENKLKSL
jgi:hypothetical protein